MKNLKIIACIVALYFIVATQISNAVDISFSWDANSESDISHYNIYRSFDSETTPTLLNSTTVTLGMTFDSNGIVLIEKKILASERAMGYGLVIEPGFTDTTCEGGGVYFYWITAVDTSGNESGFSKAIGKRASDLDPPVPPTQLHFILNLFSLVINN